MSQTSSPVEFNGDRRKPVRWFPWALLFLAMLTTVGLTKTYLSHRAHDENPLHGDADTASAGLDDLLKKTPTEQRIPLLRKYLHDTNPGLRYAAVDALGDSAEPAVARDIEGAFTDSASIVRQRALESLPKIDRERGMLLLMIGLRDEDKWIQEAAISQISSGVMSKPPFVDKRAVPFLIQALDSPNQIVSTLAMSPLRKLTGQHWKTKKGMTDAQRQGVIRQWKGWWKNEHGHYEIAPQFANIRPIRPSRTDPAPDFHISDIDGKDVNLKSQKGKVTLLNFWGTWCPPCQQEIPDLVQLDSLYRNRGLEIVGIALGEQDGADGLRIWCKAHGVEYRQALSTHAMQDAFGHIEEVPVSVLIDKQGRIRYRWEGERDLATFSSAVERLLLEQP